MTHRVAPRRRVSPMIRGLLASSALVSASLVQAQTALPQAGQVIAGSATIASSGTATVITQSSARAIIDWSSFSVGDANSVNFVQPDSRAAILNRVSGPTASTLAGAISGNGQVYLINANGIAITPSGQVNVAGGFVASTLAIADDDFMRGSLRFTGSGASAPVSNYGTIAIGSGGFAALLGGSVANYGTVSVPLGRIALGAGEAATLDLSGDGLLQLALPSHGDGKDPLITAAGSMTGARIELHAAALSGAARDAVYVPGELSARGAHLEGGVIVLDAGAGAMLVSGKLDAASDLGAGGRVAIGGAAIDLRGASVDVSGARGGSIAIGGGARGAAVAGLTTAGSVNIDRASQINASGHAAAGGDVTIWSDKDTRFAGAIVATGNAGDGGNAEVSSHGGFDFAGRVDLRSAHGAAGTLLLDPYDVSISSAADVGQSGFTANASGATINVTSLQNALATANVTVSTGASGSEAGNITVANALSWSANTRLTLDAAGGVIVNAGITNSGASSGLTLTAAGVGGVSGTGAIATAGALAVNVNHASGTGTLSGVISGSGSLTKAGSGSVTLSGANSYSGTTMISGGTLQIGAGGAAGTLGTGAVVNNAALVINRTDIPTLSNTISGTGTVAVSGTGGIIMSGVNSYSGGTTISNSAMAFIYNPSALGSGTVTINANSGMALWWNTGSSTFANNINLNSAGVSGNSFPASTAGKSAIYADGGGAGYGNYTLSGTITLGHATSSIGGFPQNSLIITGQLTGSGGLALNQSASGAGAVVTLSNATNNYTGATLIAANSNLKLGVANALPSSTALNVASGGTLNLNGLAGAVGSIAGAGSITLGAATLTTGANNSSTSFSGVVSGSGSLTKVGSGTQTLSGTNTNTGATSVSAGTLQILNTSTSAAVGVLGSGAVSIASGATLQYTNSLTVGDAYLVSNLISGAGMLSLNGPDGAITTLNNSNLFTGGTLISSGIVNLNNANGFGTGTVTMTGGAIRSTNSPRTYANNFVMSGTIGVGFATNISGTVTLAGDTTLTASANAGSTWTNLVLGSYTLATGDVGPNRLGATWSGAGLQFNGVVSGTGGITQGSLGWLTLAGANTYTGATTVNAGALGAASTSAFGNNSAVTVASGATLDLQGRSNSVGSLSGAGSIINSNAAAAILTTGGLNTSTSFSGEIQNNVGTLGLTKVGSGTQTLTGANSYSGATTVSGGTLQIGGAGVLGSGAYTGALSVASGANFNFASSANQSFTNLAAGTGTVTLAGTGNAAITGTQPFTGTLNVNQTATISGGSNSAISGVGNAAAVNIGGYVTLGGTNSFVGYTSTTPITINAGGTLYNPGTATFHLPTGLTLNGGALASAAGLNAEALGSGSFNLDGAVVVTANSTISATNVTLSQTGGTVFNVSPGAALAVSGSFGHATLGGIGDYGLNLTGSGTMTLSGTNSYTGATTVTAGTLKAGSTSAFGSNSAVTVASGATLDLAGFSNSIGALAGAGIVTNSSAIAAILTSGGLNTSTSFTGTMQNGGSTLGLTKNGTGTQSLSGTNIRYSGATQINAGTLKLTETTLFASAATVAAGATLSLARSNNGVASRARVTTTIAGAGTVSIDNDTSGIGGGWVAFNNTNVGLTSGFTGNVSVNSGVLTMDNYLGLWAASPALNIASGGLLALRGQSLAISSLSGTGDIINSWNGNAAQTLTITNPSASSFSGIIHGSVASGGSDGAIEQGVINLVKAGAGTLTLSGANSYIGTTSVNAGSLVAGSSSAFGNNSAVTVASGATLDLAGFSNSIGSLAGAGIVTNSNATAARLTAGGNNSSTSFSGLIQNGVGTTRFTKSGSGTLTFSGANSYTGGSIVSAGTLVFNHASASASGYGTPVASLTVESGATLRFAAGSSPAIRANLIVNGGTVSADLASNNHLDWGAGSITLNGGTLTSVNGVGGAANDGGLGNWHFNGTLVSVTQDALISSSSWSAGNFTADLNIASGATLRIDAAGVGLGTFSKSGLGTLLLTGANTGAGGRTNTINAGTVQIGTGGAGASFDNLNLVNNGALISNTSSSSTFYGVISGSGTLTKAGSGTLTLAGANSYTGATNIAAGTLAISSSGSLGSGNYAGAISLSGGNLTIGSSAAQTLSGAVTLGANGTISATGTGKLTVSGAVALGANTLSLGASQSNSVSAARLLDVSGVISGTGGVIASSGFPMLSGNNLFTGGVTVSSGLVIAHSNALGSGAKTVNLGNRQLVLTGGITVPANISFTTSGNAASGITTGLIYNDQGDNAIDGLVALSTGFGGTSLYANAGSLSLNGLVRTNGTARDLAIEGPGNFFFNGSLQNYGAGALSLAIGLLGGSVGTTTLSGANLFNGGITLNAGTLRVAGAGSLGTYPGTAASYGGAISIASGASFDYASSSDQTLGGIISGSGTLIKSSGATSQLLLAGANSISGSMAVNAGTLKAGATSGFGNNAVVSVASGAVVDLGGFSNAIGSLTGLGSVTNNGAAAVLSLGGNNGAAQFDGSLQDGSGVLGLTKLGSGMLTLAGSKNYTGATVISGGTLKILGSGALGGGDYGGALTLSGGNFLYDGSSAQTLSGPVTLTSNASVSNASNQLLAITGNVALGAHALTLLGNGSAADADLGAGNQNIAISGVISGTGATALVIGSASTGANVLLSGQNLFSGTLSFPATNAQPASKLTLASSGALGLGSKIISLTGGGELHLTNSISLASGISFALSGNASQNGRASTRGVIYSDQGSNVIAGALTLQGGNGHSRLISEVGAQLSLNGDIATASGLSRQLVLAGEGTTIVNGVIANGAGTTSLVVDSVSGSARLNGANSYTGPSYLLGGTLVAGNADAFGSGGGLYMTGGTLQYAPGINTDFSARLLSSGGQSWRIDTNGQDVTFASGRSGASSLTKMGGGTLTLAGANSFSGPITINGGALDLAGSLNLGAANAAIFVGAGTTLTGTGVLTAAALELSGMGNTSLTGSNAVGEISAVGPIGALSFNTMQSLGVGAIGAIGAVRLSASGAGSDLTLRSGGIASLASGDAVVLSAGRGFINQIGSGAVSAVSGRWLIYASAPTASVFNGLDSANRAIWNAPLAMLNSGSVSAAGNHYLFAYQPMVRFTSINDRKTYGTDVISALASDYTISGIESGQSGAYLADSAAIAFTGAPLVSSAGAEASASVAGSPYAINVAQGTLVAQNGYALAFDSSGVLIIDRATLRVTANGAIKTYDGMLWNGGNGVSYAGFVGGDSATSLGGSLSFGGSAQGAVDAGSYDLSATGLSSDNYMISYALGTLVIEQAPLSVTVNNAIKTYDGLAWQGGGGVRYAGFVNGEAASVLGGSLSYGGSAQNAVDAGIYTLSVTGLSSGNYAISYAPGALTINRVSLSVTANDAIKTYDGTAWQGGNGVLYTGFVNGESAAVLGGSLSFGGSAQNAVDAGVYALNVTGLSSRNYEISYAPGALTIDRASLTVTANDASKTYDGLAWQGGNGVRYAGFVNGENAAVLGGSLSYGGSAQGAVDAGSYALSIAGLASGNYVISYAPGALTINRASLQVTANDAVKTYDGLGWSGGNGVRYQGFVNGESEAVLGGSLNFGGSAQGATDAGVYALSVAGLSSNNYDIRYLPGSVRIGSLSVAQWPSVYTAAPESGANRRTGQSRAMLGCANGSGALTDASLSASANCGVGQ